MARKTIHTLAYKLLVDSSQFEKGLVASRKELNQARKVMREMITPAEKIETEFAKLGNLLKKGAIDQDLFNRKAADLRKQYDEATGAAQKRRDAEKALNQQMERGKQLTKSLRTAEEKHVDTMMELRKLLKSGAINQETYNRAMTKSRNTLPAVIAAKKRLEDAEKRELARVQLLAKRRDKLRFAMKAGAAAIAVAAVAAGRRTIASVNEQINRVDALAKSSEKLGVSTQFLTRFQFVAGKTSGLSDESTAKAFEKMTRRVSEAAAGGGEAVNVLKEIGLEAKALANSGPERAMLTIARAMDKVTNEHDRIRIATKLFDDEQAGLHTTLKLTNKELLNQFDRADKLGVTVSDFDASQMVRAKDAIDEMNRALEGFATEFAVNVAPAITQVLDELNSLLSEGERRQGKTFLGNLATATGNAATATIRTAKDLEFGDNLATIGLNFVRNAKEVTIESLTSDIKRRQEFEEKQQQKQAEFQKREMERARAAFAAEKQAKAKEMEEKRQALMQERVEKRKARLEELEAAKQDFMSKRQEMFNELKRQREESLTVTKSGPLEDMVAGSSEEFRFLNQTSAVKDSKVQLQEEQLAAARASEQHLRDIAASIAEERERP